MSSSVSRSRPARPAPSRPRTTSRKPLPRSRTVRCTTCCFSTLGAEQRGKTKTDMRLRARTDRHHHLNGDVPGNGASRVESSARRRRRKKGGGRSLLFFGPFVSQVTRRSGGERRRNKRLAERERGTASLSGFLFSFSLLLFLPALLPQLRF